MRGQPSRCCICGAIGSVMGCPSWWDQCQDEAACRDRALYNKEVEIKALKREVKELQESK